MLGLSVALLTIPGIKGFEPHFFGIYLGRVQPFKFVFVAWLILQTAYLLMTNSAGFLFSRTKSSATIWALVLGFDFLLAVGLIGEPGPSRGPGIFASMILGQFAAFLTVLDSRFPFRAFFRGMCAAAIVLTAFAVCEKVFPNSWITYVVMKYFRDGQVMGWQVGSSLTTSGLAEFCVRALPLVLVGVLSDRLNNSISALLLLFLGFATVERNAALSIFAMVLVVLMTPVGRKYWKAAGIGLVFLMIGAAFIAGPQIMVSKYMGAFESKPTDSYSYSAKNTIRIREKMWHRALEVIRYAPIRGIGLDGYAYRNLHRLPPLDKDGDPTDGRHCHNMFLEFGASGGVLALLLWVGIVGFYGAAAILAVPKRWAAVLYFAAQIPSMMTDVRIYVSWLAITLFWFAAIAWVLGNGSKLGASEKVLEPT